MHEMDYVIWYQFRINIWPKVISISMLKMRKLKLNLYVKRGPNLFFKYFYFLFGTGLFYPFRVPAKVQIFWGSLAGPLTLLHPKMELLWYREPLGAKGLIVPLNCPKKF